MAYNFKNLADVELLNAMPEEANVLVEVDGATKRAPHVEVDVTAELISSEALEEVPEGATVLAEVNGEIKRVPSAGLGGSGDAWDIMIFYNNDDDSYNWFKGDSTLLIEMLVAGKCPRTCIFYTNNDIERPAAMFEIIYGMEISSGSGTWINMYGHNGSWYFNASDGIVYPAR